MSNYAEKLKSLGKAWKTTKKAERSTVEDAKYQVSISAARLEETKQKGLEGDPQITLEMTVISGPLKGKKVPQCRYPLTAVNDDGEHYGISMLKRDLDAIGIEEPDITSEKSIKKLCDELLNTVLEIEVKTSKKGYQNTWIKRAIDASEDEEETEETEEEETEEESEEEESEEEEEEEEKPAKKPVKKPAKKQEEEEEEEETEDEEEAEEEEEEEEEAPKKKSSIAEKLAKKKKAAKVEEEEDDDDIEKMWEK